MSEHIDTDAYADHVKGYRSSGDEAWDRGPICRECGAAWPCAVALLRDEVDRLRSVIRALDVRPNAVYMSGGGYYHGGGVLTPEQCEAVYHALTTEPQP